MRAHTTHVYIGTIAISIFCIKRFIFCVRYVRPLLVFLLSLAEKQSPVVVVYLASAFPRNRSAVANF